MPVFGLAALWNGSAPPERVAAWVEGIGEVLTSAQSLQLVVALRPEEAGIELKVEAPGYPRSAVERLAEDAKRSGGTFVELWRLPKAERDAFRAAAFGGGTTYRGDECAAAARVLQQHLTALPVSSVRPAGPTVGGTAASVPQTSPKPVEAPAPAPSNQPHQVLVRPPEGPQRRGRRFAVKLEMEFRTELDFVREHALNISNGGLFVRTAHRPLPDSVVTVDVKLPNGERLQGDAVVVHVVDDPYTGGVGLAFLNDDATFSQTLDDYLASLAGGVG